MMAFTPDTYYLLVHIDTADAIPDSSASAAAAAAASTSSPWTAWDFECAIRAGIRRLLGAVGGPAAIGAFDIVKYDEGRQEAIVALEHHRGAGMLRAALMFMGNDGQGGEARYRIRVVKASSCLSALAVPRCIGC